jgi:hypothetical protein
VGKRGRPRSQRAAAARIVYLKMRLYPGEDDDLIAFVAGIPKGLLAASIKRALRDGVQGDAPAVRNDELLSLLDDLVD